MRKIEKRHCSSLKKYVKTKKAGNLPAFSIFYFATSEIMCAFALVFIEC